jgi:hypothetical protein
MLLCGRGRRALHVRGTLKGGTLDIDIVGCPCHLGAFVPRYEGTGCWGPGVFSRVAATAARVVAAQVVVAHDLTPLSNGSDYAA